MTCSHCTISKVLRAKEDDKASFSTVYSQRDGHGWNEILAFFGNSYSKRLWTSAVWKKGLRWLMCCDLSWRQKSCRGTATAPQWSLPKERVRAGACPVFANLPSGVSAPRVCLESLWVCVCAAQFQRVHYVTEPELVWRDPANRGVMWDRKC